ncbi:uncharacterized protein TRAVEDRAFT_48933 [Trametes versicolor FP-101664 SS1]|uniref:uncharacterized protein n=1 Tax=Trametes versicolor (strain FP-101664) TaxID=717944 RepID=UPI0004621A60|nr:uncharacterized protein TRAVEDRAFT_48933 [Trametes versicolor FP-101664 SS1]EIW57911.1 hypothetical protein TRAVEDRAFT_48933 [Trametes versicolor FP-101664 SS1]
MSVDGPQDRDAAAHTPNTPAIAPNTPVIAPNVPATVAEEIKVEVPVAYLNGLELELARTRAAVTDINAENQTLVFIASLATSLWHHYYHHGEWLESMLAAMLDPDVLRIVFPYK